tara:strand:+ start:23182 stop:23634 length:453 start_codon:yes stop_codon:yes gene_type:complete
VSILRRVDAWLGKTLFHPPIILLCQQTRQSQYAIHRALWFFAACHATYYAMADGVGWAQSIFLWIFVIIMLVSASFDPDRPARSLFAIRLLFWVFFITGLIACAITSSVTDGTVRAVMILFAEYAATIKTIPPRTTRESRAADKEAFNGQ